MSVAELLFALYFTKTDQNADKGKSEKYLALVRCFRQNDRNFL